MGFGYIFAGFIFLFNPNVNIIDIMPDFIGYGLILYGMYRLRDLAPAIADSRRTFVRLFVLSLFKTGVLFLISGWPDKGYLLVFTFIFTLAEFVFLIPAFGNYFDGLFFAGTMYDGTETVRRLTSAKAVTMLFIVSRGVFTLLPELIYLYVTEDLGYILSAYKGVLNILSVLLSLAAGIIWLVFMRSLHKAVIGDRHFINNMSVYYTEYIKSDRKLFLRRRMKTALTLFAAGFIFLPDIYLDGIDYLPDTAGLICIITGLFMTAKYMRKHKLQLALGSAAALFSAAGWYYMKIFSDRFYAYGIGRSMESYRMFLVAAALSAAEAVLLILLTAAMTAYLMSMIKDHTGPETESEFNAAKAKDEYQKKKLRRKTIVFAVLGTAAAVSGAVYTLCLYYWPEYWMVNTAVSILWLITAFSLTHELGEEIEHRYL